MEIRTERLLLRQFQNDDQIHLAKMNRDPTTMEFIGTPLNDEQSAAMFDRITLNWIKNGFGLFALEVPGEAEFIGFTGLSIPTFQTHFTPCVEIGWRLASEFWDHGYATEAAKAVKLFAFGTIGLNEIVSYTAAKNLRSQHVMDKIGLTRDVKDDFEHPKLSKSNPLCRHVLYRKSRSLRAEI